MAELKRVGNLFGDDHGVGFAGNVWDKNGLSPTLTTMAGGYREPMIVAMRGRDPDDPSNRAVGVHTEQRLEPNKDGLSNTLTTV